MKTIRCQYCHEEIPEDEIYEHEAAHRELQEDGQQESYATLPEDEREQGDLAGVPMVYVHRTCGTATGMPEDIVRSYLKNPYYLLASNTFCCGCEKHVPLSECEWTETGQQLDEYFTELQAARPDLKPKGCGCTGLLVIGFIASAATVAAGWAMA